MKCSKRRTVFIGIGLLLAYCLTHGRLIEAGQTTITTEPNQFDSVRTYINARLIEDQIPSVAVAVGRKDQILWEEAFGWADRENRIPATEHTIYSIGSVAKPMTGTGLMVLVQQGKVQLDQPVNIYLGEPKLNAHVGDITKATVRSLANHSSGLARYSANIYADEPDEPLQIDESIRRYGHLVREPGETYEYSNLGYDVLAHLVERVAQRRFNEFMRQEVFLPLGMTHTAVGMGSRLEKSYAVSYARDQTPIPFDLIKRGHPGAGGIYSSVHDLLRFGLFHLRHLQHDQKRILEDKYIVAMHQPTMSIPGVNGWGLRNNGYGIGWNITPDRFGYRQIFHSGHDGYATALLTLLPDEDICLVVVINGGDPVSVVLIADKVLAILLPKYAARIKESASTTRTEQTDAQTYKPTEQFLGHWAGNVQTYAQTIPIEVWFKESGDIHVQMRGQLRTLLSGARIENGYFRASFNGDIGTADANRHRPYNLHLKLKPRGNVLNGSITASTLPGRRAGDVLSYWIEMTKVISEAK
jgi:CubicO group peptidase (beta-lactamase class C family)